MTNYPPGVTGREYEIAGPDWEREVDGPCPRCGHSDTLIQEGYLGVVTTHCTGCGYEQEEDYGPDPDRGRDELEEG